MLIFWWSLGTKNIWLRLEKDPVLVATDTASIRHWLRSLLACTYTTTPSTSWCDIYIHHIYYTYYMVLSLWHVQKWTCNWLAEMLTANIFSCRLGSFVLLQLIWSVVIYYTIYQINVSWPTTTTPDWTAPGRKRAGIRAMLIHIGFNSAPGSCPAAGKGNRHMGTTGNQRLCPHLYRDLSMSQINLSHSQWEVDSVFITLMLDAHLS